MQKDDNNEKMKRKLQQNSRRNDHTPYNVMHETDMEMIQHYQLQGQIVVISLVEQAMRVYQNGQLVRAFSITTGRPELPSMPGIWQELYRSSPATLVSAFPNNSPYWFPKTRVNYAILYQTGGHLIVDSSWRGTYGPGTQFPHRDATGIQKSRPAISYTKSPYFASSQSITPIILPSCASILRRL